MKKVVTQNQSKSVLSGNNVSLKKRNRFHSLLLALFTLMVFLVPSGKVEAQCPTSVTYSAGTFTFTYSGSVPTGTYDQLRVTISSGTGSGGGGPYLLTIVSSTPTTITTNDGGGVVDGTSVASAIEYYLGGSGPVSGPSTCNTSTPLPVTLNYVTAKLSDGKVLIEWMTSTEINNDRFEIERRTEFSEFEKIGSVIGVGNSTQNKKYKFIDNQPASGKVFYRLKQVDYNGVYEYSRVVTVKSQEEEKIILTMYPNPVNDMDKNIVVNVGVAHPEGSLYISDLTGQNVLKTDFVNVSQLVDIRSLPVGIYILRYHNPEGINLNKKLIVQQ